MFCKLSGFSKHLFKNKRAICRNINTKSVNSCKQRKQCNIIKINKTWWFKIHNHFKTWWFQDFLGKYLWYHFDQVTFLSRLTSLLVLHTCHRPMKKGKVRQKEAKTTRFRRQKKPARLALG